MNSATSALIFGIQNPILALFLLLAIATIMGVLINLAAHRSLVDKVMVTLKDSFLLILIVHIIVLWWATIVTLASDFDYASLSLLFIPFIIWVFTKLKLDDDFPWWKALLLYPLNVLVYYFLFGIILGFIARL